MERNASRPLSIIVARADNGVIGRDNAMPWHIPDDLKYFRKITLGKPVLMGRKTFVSLQRPLPGRPNLVVSRDPHFTAEGVEIFSSLESALRRGQELSAASGADEIMLIGGAQVFAEGFPHVSRLYLTEIHSTPDGDVFFPPFDRSQWSEISRHPVAADNAVPAHDFVVLERNSGLSRPVSLVR